MSTDTYEEFDENQPITTLEPEKEVVQEPVQIIKREYQNPYSNIKDINKDTSDRRIIVVPSGIYSKALELSKKLEPLLDEAEDFVDENLTDEQKVALDISINGLTNTAVNGAFTNKVNTDTWDQNLHVDGKEIKIRELKVRPDQLTGVLTGNKALTKLNSFLGLSNEIQIPLYHSGFHITLNRLPEAEVIGLTSKLAKEKIELGKNTSGLVFSNDNVLYTRIILEFILEHMKDTTLKIPLEDDIRDYIKGPDIYALAIGVLRSIEPSGFKISRTCINALEINKEFQPECDFTMTASLDMEAISWVDKDNMDEYHRKLMTKRSPNSITKEEVLKYQDTLNVLKPKDIPITIGDNTVVITLQVPTALENIDAGDMWIEDIQNSVEVQLASIVDVTDEKRVDLLSKMSKATLLNRYLHYVKSITLGNSEILDRETISESLNSMVSTDAIYTEVATSFSNFVENNVIVVYGMPQYTCPTCQDNMDILEDAFKEIIPLNIYHTFLEGCTLKVYELEKRTAII